MGFCVVAHKLFRDTYVGDESNLLESYNKEPSTGG
jgi:hypothetical protein